MNMKAVLSCAASATRLLKHAAAGVLGLVLIGAGPALSAYPEKPITIICASGAGGIVDVTTRLLAEHMSNSLGRSIIVENQPGAGTTIAIKTVAQAAPDGYTLLVIGSSVSVVKEMFPQLNADVLKDLAPVSMMAVAPMVLLVHSSVPATDYSSLVAFAKANPSKLSVGSNGRGSAGYLAAELMKKMAGAPIKYIPYRTTPEAQNDLISGRLSMMFTTPMTDHIASGTLKAIGSTTVDRTHLLPEVPTFHELGLKGFDASSWSSMFAPAGTPPEVLGKLARAVQAAVADPAIKEKFKSLGLVEPPGLGPDFHRTYLEQDVKKWTELLRSTPD